MQHFTGTQYLMIDIANCFGLDRLDWDDRMHWYDNNEPRLEDQEALAKNPLLYMKAVRAMRLVQKGQPTNHIMGLDATASGLQIMAALSGCYDTARATNLVNTGHREDVYGMVAGEMNKIPGVSVTREDCKQPVMTTFYGSTAQPKAAFGEGEVLGAYYTALEKQLGGAFELMKLFQQYWNPYAKFHNWTLPDGHVARVPVVQTVEKNIEIDEADHMRFAYRAQINEPKPRSRSLAANIVHSIDAWVVRQMVQAADKQGFQMAPIHDCFFASPNHMDKVRENYIKIMMWIADHDFVGDILTEVAGRRVDYIRRSDTLSYYIQHAEYPLS